MINKNNKKAMSISITLLVMFTLLIVFVTLAIFITKTKSLKQDLEVSGTLDSVYLNETMINYYVNDIIEKSVNDFNIDSGKQVFIDNLKKELEKYKDSNGIYYVSELEQIEPQIKEENLGLTQGLDGDIRRVFLTLDLSLTKIEKKDSSQLMKIEYNYTKSFSKDF
jgi:hypothetical protein